MKETRRTFGDGLIMTLVLMKLQSENMRMRFAILFINTILMALIWIMSLMLEVMVILPVIQIGWLF